MKHLRIFLALICATVCWQTALAYDTYVTIDGLKYGINITGKAAVVISNSNSGNIVIPATLPYEGFDYPVTSIGNGAFNECTDLTKITIPNSVTSIGEWAFSHCTSLKSITIPNSVTSSIGEDAFSGCTSLTDVTIGNSVTSIRRYAFAGCTSLKSITIPSSVTSISEGAFLGCSNLESISVSKENTEYDSRDNCNAIIETATNTLIAGCQNTVIPNSITSIGDDAFCNCKDLTSVTIPNSVTSIGEGAFYGCNSLTSITIPESVTSLGNECFWDCTNLKSITIPSSVTEIGEEAFLWCSNLESISVSKENTVYDSRDNCNAIIETASNTLIYGCKNTVIPSSVTEIGKEAFYYCTGLTSIEIPNSVTYIGQFAFWSCTDLTSITIGNSVTFIYFNAFEDCDSLKSVTSLSATPPRLYYGPFSDKTYEQATLYVPTGSADAYRSADGWKKFTNIVEEDLTAIKPVTSDREKPTVIYDLEGHRLRAPQKGINIINGRKVLVK